MKKGFLRGFLSFCVVLILTQNLSFAVENTRDCGKFLKTELDFTNPKVRKNPLLTESPLFEGAIPHDRITTDLFHPAFKRGLKVAKARVEVIRNNSEAPTFQNTIEALEDVTAPFDNATYVLSNYTSLKTNNALEEVEKKISIKRSRFEFSVFSDPVIFAKVKAVYEKRDSLNLSPAQMTLLQNTFDTFINNGVLLTQEQKSKLAAINQKISLLGMQFDKNNLDAVTNYKLVVTDESKLKGIPENDLKRAKDLANKKGVEGWAFGLQQASLTAVLTNAEDRSLREELWRASNTRGSVAPYDNRPVLLEIVKLKTERAKILGFKTVAEHILKTEGRMAKNPETVMTFLGKLADSYRVSAEKEFKELETFAGMELMPWDTAFYSNRLKAKNYGYDEEELRQYFSLERVIEGALYTVGRLYGLKFKERSDLPTWDASVKAYEVLDENGKYISLFYLDPYPRDNKRQGAWMNVFRTSGLFEGKMRRPHVLNSGNFTPPVGDTPALLTLREVTTVFHELGHGIHGIVSQARYRSMSGPSVATDFVELPSQVLENWATVPEVLEVYARHYKTGAVIPQELLEKVNRAQNFQAGSFALRQVNFGMLDMAWHSSDLSEIKSPEDVASWEEKVTARTRVHKSTYGSMISPWFSHIFSGGYSAGYYSYKWAEVLDADAFSVFERDGVFNQETAARFRREILERGGEEPADVLYRRFRQGEIDQDALLRREGLL